MNKEHAGWAAVLAAGMAAAAAQGGMTFYVDDDNCPGPGDGSPGDPFCSIQDAIVAAFDGDEVLVAPGTYPGTIDFLGRAVTVRSSGGAPVTFIDGQGTGPVVVATSAESADTVLDGFTITGGSAPAGGGLRIISADLTVRNCTIASNTADQGGGLTVAGSSAATFTACRFIANNASAGGAIYNESWAGLTLDRCLLAENNAVVGGGINSRDDSLLVAVDSIFAGNADSSSVGAAAIGGFGATLIIDRCAFSGNDRCAIECGFGVLRVTNSVFVGNDGNAVVGGGILDINESSLIANCLFAGNLSPARGGGIYSSADANQPPVIVNCTFVDNFPLGLQTLEPPNTEVYNCIFWGNGLGQIAGDPLELPASASVYSSDVEGGYAGPGANNIDAPPMLAGGPSGTWTAQAVYDPATGLTTYVDASASYVPGALKGMLIAPWVLIEKLHFIVDNTETAITIPGDIAILGFPGAEYRIEDLHLTAASPCIDAADNALVPEEITVDIDGEPRFLDVPETPDTGLGDPPIVDMGADEARGDGCLAILSQEVACHGDGTTFTVSVEGLNACTGDTTMATFTGSGGAIGEDFCATLIVNTAQGGYCCSTQLCVPVPDCSGAAPLCDLDGDGVVGVLDLLALLAAWGPNPGHPADVDGDGVVGVGDFLLLLADWA